MEWLQICAKLSEIPGRPTADWNGAELPSVASLIILIVFLILVVLDGSPGVNPTPSLLLPAPPALRVLLFLIAEENDSASAAKIP